MNNDYQTPQPDMELENMRRQMNTLKKKLEQQEIVNDRIIRQSMKKTAGNITRRYYALIAIALAMIPYSYWAFIVLTGLSTTFWIGTSIFMLVSAGATYYNLQRNINNANMMHGSLVEVRRNMARAKKFDADWLYIGIPAVILWLAWFAYEVWVKNGDDAAIGLLIGGGIGGIIGACIGLNIHFKTQHQYQEIIDQIEDLTAE